MPELRCWLNADPLAPSEARRAVVSACTDWGLERLRPTAELLTSELVTNGVQHAVTELELVVTAVDRTLTVEVADHEAAMPQVRTPRHDLLADIDDAIAADDSDAGLSGGRGLLLVEAMADDWGVVPLPDGKAVWFRLVA